MSSVPLPSGNSTSSVNLSVTLPEEVLFSRGFLAIGRCGTALCDISFYLVQCRYFGRALSGGRTSKGPRTLPVPAVCKNQLDCSVSPSAPSDQKRQESGRFDVAGSEISREINFHINKLAGLVIHHQLPLALHVVLKYRLKPLLQGGKSSSAEPERQ